MSEFTLIPIVWVGNRWERPGQTFGPPNARDRLFDVVYAEPVWNAEFDWVFEYPVAPPEIYLLHEAAR